LKTFFVGTSSFSLQTFWCIFECAILLLPDRLNSIFMPSGEFVILSLNIFPDKK